MDHNAVSSSHKDLMRLRLPRRRNYADRAWRIEKVRDIKEYEYWACVIFLARIKKLIFCAGSVSHRQDVQENLGRNPKLGQLHCG
jgi:hypothetical protein